MSLDVRTTRVRADLHTPFVTALRSTSTIDTVVVRISDGDGHTGYGEAPQVWRVTGESLESAQACVEGPLGAVVRDRHPDDLVGTLRAVSAAVHGNAGAKAAVDVALHDLAARRLGVPLCVLLGGAARPVPTDVTVSVSDPAASARDALARQADGFSVLKLKVGTTVTQDVAMVREVRAAVGPTTTLRIDANQAWTPREAVAAIRAMEDTNLAVELVEQPVPAWDLDGLGWVRDRVETPLLADEAVFGIRDLVAVIARHAADLVNVKLAKCGGLRPAVTLLDLARAHGVGTMIGSMMESHVGVGAAASLAVAYGSTVTDDLDAAWWITRSPYVGGVTYDGGDVHLSAGPGLGIDGITP